MDLGIKGKRVLVTAASRGIGESAAVQLAKEGALVSIVARNEKDLRHVMDQMGGEKNGHYMLVSDLVEEGAPKRVYEQIVKNFGNIDILVNNIGDSLGIKDPFCSLEEWKRLYRINLEVTVEFSNLTIPYMTEMGWGRICNVSSTAGMENNGPVPFCSMKAALTSYSRSMGRVLAKSGIVMTAIMPGAVDTKGGYWEGKSEEHIKKYLDERCPLGKFGESDEIGTIIAILCSQQASFCQGSIVPVDGGQSRHFFWSRDWDG